MGKSYSDSDAFSGAPSGISVRLWPGVLVSTLFVGIRFAGLALPSYNALELAEVPRGLV